MRAVFKKYTNFTESPVLIVTVLGSNESIPESVPSFTSTVLACTEVTPNTSTSRKAKPAAITERRIENICPYISFTIIPALKDF